MRVRVDKNMMVLSEIAARSIGIPEPSARFLIALFSGEFLLCVICGRYGDPATPTAGHCADGVVASAFT